MNHEPDDEQITEENYQTHYLQFQDRQAGVSLIYDNLTSSYKYNVYCLERKLMKEIMSVEHDYLEDAIINVNEEFPSWELTAYGEKSGCGSCVAK